MKDLSVQRIFRDFAGIYAAGRTLTSTQKKALTDIIGCRTEEMGTHIDECPVCGYQRTMYNSCRNRHCPSCQTFAKVQWIEKQQQHLLDIPFFHVVFTVPAELNTVFLGNPAEMYNLLFQAASETILELAADEKLLGAQPGIISVLHTWGQNLSYHPHIHMIVTGGGITPYDTWKSRGDNFFLPVKVLSKKFKGKFLSLLKATRADVPQEILNACWDKKWVVYCKKPFGGARQVVEYLGRYTHRVAISDNRIVDYSEGKVTFTYRDYRDGNRKKQMTLDAVEFIRRFMLHILPARFRKIRCYGLFAPRNKKARLEKCRRLTRSPDPPPPRSAQELLESIFGPDWNLCPNCRKGRLARDPPL